MRQRSQDRAAAEAESHSLVTWRQARLLAAGFDGELAASVAARCNFDIHAVLQLVDRGCPPTLAARVAAPLEEGRRPC